MSAPTFHLSFSTGASLTTLGRSDLSFLQSVRNLWSLTWHFHRENVCIIVLAFCSVINDAFKRWAEEEKNKRNWKGEAKEAGRTFWRAQMSCKPGEESTLRTEGEQHPMLPREWPSEVFTPKLGLAGWRWLVPSMREGSVSLMAWAEEGVDCKKIDNVRLGNA